MELLYNSEVCSEREDGDTVASTREGSSTRTRRCGALRFFIVAGVVEEEEEVVPVFIVAGVAKK